MFAILTDKVLAGFYLQFVVCYWVELHDENCN